MSEVARESCSFFFFIHRNCSPKLYCVTFSFYSYSEGVKKGKPASEEISASESSENESSEDEEPTGYDDEGIEEK
jgi:hypothetical protein